MLINIFISIYRAKIGVFYSVRLFGAGDEERDVCPLLFDLGDFRSKVMQKYVFYPQFGSFLGA